MRIIVEGLVCGYRARARDTSGDTYRSTYVRTLGSLGGGESGKGYRLRSDHCPESGGCHDPRQLKKRGCPFIIL